MRQRAGSSASIAVLLLLLAFATTPVEAQSPTTAVAGSSRVATSCATFVGVIALRNECGFPIDIAYCLDSEGTAFSCRHAEDQIARATMRLDAKARVEWPLALRQLPMKRGEKVALFACRHDPDDPVEPILTASKPPAGYCV